MNKAEELITCLEREITKRDARIGELEGALSWHEEQRNDMAELRAELAASKAQEPVAWVRKYEDRIHSHVDWHRSELDLIPEGAPLYAAPVSEAKAQGVVMPERWNVPRPMWKDARQPYGNPLNHADIEAAEKFNLALDEVARLNAANVQQVSVPDVSAMARILADRNADACNVNREDNWMIYGQDYIDDVTAMLAAAPAAPAADSGLVEALENVLKSGRGSSGRIILDEEDEADARSALADHRAKGVV